MRFSILIPTYKLELLNLERALNSLFKYTDLSDKEVIVIANGQSPDVLNYLRNLPKIKLLEFSEPLGYSRAINEGLKIARGEFIVLLNDDIELLEQPVDLWIGYLVEPFWDNPRVGITGPLSAPIQITENKSYEFILFFCVMIKREVFLRIGLLDEGFEVGGYEDVDFCIRAQNAGYEIKRVPTHNPVVVPVGETMFSGLFPIYHEGSYTMTKLTEPQGIYEKNFERLKAKHGGTNEGMIIGKNDVIPFFEKPRYLFAKEFIENWILTHRRKPKVLELGCGSGYGVRFIRDLILEYKGLDNDEHIVRFANIDYGAPNIRFEVFDITKDKGSLVEQIRQHDIVIAFEVLEHIEELREIFNIIATYSKDFIVSVPYKETEEKKWWAHKHINLSEEDFKIPDVGQQFAFQGWNGLIYQNPSEPNTIKTLLVYSTIRTPKFKILAYVITRNRFNTTLPLTLLSLVNQNRTPDKIVVINDGQEENWIASPIYDYLIKIMREKNILFEFIKNPGQGQVVAHQFVNKELGKEFDFVWRIDDDEVAEANVLEGIELFIYEHGDEQIGAVGPACRLPSMFFDKNIHPLSDFGLKLSDIHLPNIQWSDFDIPVEVEHLHSTFVYKPNIVDYPSNLSRIGHREETMFTYSLYRKGYKLFALPYLVTYHLQMPFGGLREEADGKMWADDEQRFQQFAQSLGVKILPPKWIVLANGLGDIFAFKQILPEIQRKYKDHQIIIACNVPEAFWDVEGIKIIRIETASKLLPNIDHYNVYYWMAQNQWDKSIVEAFRRLYV